MDKRTISAFALFMAAVVVAAGGIWMLYNEQPELPAGPEMPRIVYAPTSEPWKANSAIHQELPDVQMAVADASIAP